MNFQSTVTLQWCYALAIVRRCSPRADCVTCHVPQSRTNYTLEKRHRKTKFVWTFPTARVRSKVKVTWRQKPQQIKWRICRVITSCTVTQLSPRRSSTGRTRRAGTIFWLLGLNREGHISRSPQMCYKKHSPRPSLTCSLNKNVWVYTRKIFLSKKSGGSKHHASPPGKFPRGHLAP